jgi:CheY-like chemotaxis protein
MGVLKQLRQDDLTMQIPVIISSVLSRRESIDQLREMGANDFVSKSAGIDALITKTMDYLASGM